MTVNEVISRMEAGEKLRMVALDELHDNAPSYRRMFIGRSLVMPETTVFDVMFHPRIRQLPGNKRNDQPYIDYELI